MLFDFFTVRITINEMGGVEIKGVDARNLENDIWRLYNTSVIGKYMFIRSGSVIRTREFFLLELHHILSRLLTVRKTYTRRKQLLELKELLEKETWIKDTINPTVYSPNISYLAEFFKTPFTTQKDLLDNYLTIVKNYKLKGLLLDGAAGSGKTLTSLMWSRMLNGNVTKTIVLCPPKLVNKVWKETLDKEFRVVPPYWTSMSGEPLDTQAEFFILHYDFLTNKGFEDFERFMCFYKKAGNQFKLIIDECHNFNDPSSNRTQKIIQLADRGFFSHALPMSGTPLKACSKESYAIFSITDPLFVGSARDKFKDAYGRGRERLNELFTRRIGRNKFTIAAIDGMAAAPDTEVINVSFKGAEQYTIDAIRLRMLNYITQRRNFYQQHLPAIRAQYLSCVEKYESKIKRDNLALEELSLYKRYVHLFNQRGFNSFEDGDKSKFCKSVEVKIEGVLSGKERMEFRSNCSAVKYVGLKIQGEVIGNVFGAARRECAKAVIEHAGLVDLVNHVEKKTLIFSTYVEAVEAAEEYFIQHGFNPVTITGKNLGNTDSEIRRFESDPKVNPMITTYKSLKEGYPLTMANQLIMIDVPFREYEVIQTKARIHRKGQDTDTFFWCLRLDTGEQPNISTTTLDILQWSKEQVAEMMLDIEGHELGNLFNEITGNELYEISLEPDSVPVTSYRTSYDLFN